MKRAISVAALLTAAAWGCTSTTSSEPDPFTERADHLAVASGTGALFLVQDVVGADAMDALFQGRITIDDSGCLRLETEGSYGVTAVWPHRYELRGDGELRVADAAGELVGVIGDTFHLGGGEVPELTEALGFTPGDQELAHASCPGRYWIVSGP